jgi:hypothetical protein
MSVPDVVKSLSGGISVAPLVQRYGRLVFCSSASILTSKLIVLVDSSPILVTIALLHHGHRSLPSTYLGWFHCLSNFSGFPQHCSAGHWAHFDSRHDLFPRTNSQDQPLGLHLPCWPISWPVHCWILNPEYQLEARPWRLGRILWLFDTHDYLLW